MAVADELRDVLQLWRQLTQFAGEEHQPSGGDHGNVINARGMTHGFRRTAGRFLSPTLYQFGGR